jgi:hypothetical protein
MCDCSATAACCGALRLPPQCSPPLPRLQSRWKERTKSRDTQFPERVPEFTITQQVYRLPSSCDFSQGGGGEIYEPFYGNAQRTETEHDRFESFDSFESFADTT